MRALVSNGVTVTIIRPAAEGSFPTFGDVTAEPSSTEVTGCAVWPATTSELVTQQDTVRFDLHALLPPGTDVLSTDRIEVDGIVYQVVGEPQKWDSFLLKASAGVEVLLAAGRG